MAAHEEDPLAHLLQSCDLTPLLLSCYNSIRRMTMALRTTSSLVKGILLKDYDTRRSPSLDPFILTANAMVDRLAIRAGELGVTVSSTSLELIERWLAAHCYVMSDRNFAANATSSASATYQGQTGMNLDASFYGQTAQTLDPTGLLSVINKRASASVVWLGKNPTQQIPYEQRR